ncbi:uncharacterized protein DFL_003750 [Arthrobotrys flagrans]|uniref:Uncharacterized protein n=1 Tax=Arthrobotrys flagrans TaxID=97331 RepID=A0A437A2W0_ARTFL|nr:hypothetical protein DFL_003750 [Arthrobotrys flagrans]
MAVPPGDKIHLLLLSLVLFLSLFDITLFIPHKEVTPARFHDTSIIKKWKTSTSISIGQRCRFTQSSTVTSADPELYKGYPIPTALQHILTPKICEKCPDQTVTNFRDPVTPHPELWVYGRITIFQWRVIEFWEQAFQNSQPAVYRVSQHGKPGKQASYIIGIALHTNSKITLGTSVTYNMASFVPHPTKVTIHNPEGGYQSTIHVARAPTAIPYMCTTRFQTAVYVTITQTVQLTDISIITDGSGSLIKASSVLPLPSPTTIKCATTWMHTNEQGSTLTLTLETSITVLITVPGCTQAGQPTPCTSSTLTGAQESSVDLSPDWPLSAGIQPSMGPQLSFSVPSEPPSGPGSSEAWQTTLSSTSISDVPGISPLPMLEPTVSTTASSNSESLPSITSASTSWYEMVTQTIYSGSASRTSMTIGDDGNPTAIIVLPTGLGGIRFTTILSGSATSETIAVGLDGAITVIEILPTRTLQVESNIADSTVLSPVFSVELGSQSSNGPSKLYE